MFLLTDLPVGVTQSRMTDLAMIMRPFGHVIANVSGSCRNFSAYDGNGFTAFAFDTAKESGGAELTRSRIRRVRPRRPGQPAGPDDPERLRSPDPGDRRSDPTTSCCTAAPSHRRCGCRGA